MAKVAPSTVSGVLNRPQRVRQETRKRIEDAIQTLGYVHQRVGRPPRDTKQHVAVVTGAHLHCLPSVSRPGREVPTDAALIDSENFLVRAMHRAVIDQGHHIHSYAGYRSVMDNGIFREAAEDGALDGVILVRESPDDGYIDWMLQRGIPLIVINREPSPDRPFSAVSMDNFGGGRQAAEHFLATGRRRLGVLQADNLYSYNRQRTAGFLAAARDAGADEPMVVQLESWEQLSDAFGQIADAGVTGLFATTDTLAVGCLGCAQLSGLDVPGDMAMVGFDNAEHATCGGLRLSSVGYDLRDMAHVALGALDMLCQYRQKLGHLDAVVKTRLYEHDTTDPAGPERD